MEKSKILSLNFYLFIGVFTFSFLLTYFLNLYLNSKIEYKFVNSLNEENYEKSLSFLCKESIEISQNYSNYYKIYDLINEDKKFLIKNFKIEGIFPKNNKKDNQFLYGVNFSYDLVYPDFLVKLQRVYDKKIFIKNENGKECISFMVD